PANEAELRGANNDPVDSIAQGRVTLFKGSDLRFTDVIGGNAASRRENVIEPARLRRNAGHVEQRDRAVARERRAEMLHLVGGRHALDADEGRDLPIVAGEAADNAAERAPFVELARREADIDDQCRLPPFLEVVAVARR